MPDATLLADIDQDIKAACITRWKNDAALNLLDSIGPRDGKLEGNRPDSYVTIKVKNGERPDECFGAHKVNADGTVKIGVAWKVFRSVTLTFYGSKEKMSGALKAIGDVFKPALYKQLVMPSGAMVFNLFWKRQADTEQDDTKDKKAVEIWKAVYEFEVGTVRGDV